MTEIKFTILEDGITVIKAADAAPQIEGQKLSPTQMVITEAVDAALTDIAAGQPDAEHIITDLEADCEAWHVRRGKPPSSTPASGRRVLPQRREGETFTLKHGNQNAAFTVTVGFFPASNRLGYTVEGPTIERIEHAPAEVFIQGPKAGSEVEGIARDFAVVLSIALQYGAPIDVIRHSLTREEDGTPQTIAGKVVDAICNPQFNGPPTTEEGHG